MKGGTILKITIDDVEKLPSNNDEVSSAPKTKKKRFGRKNKKKKNKQKRRMIVGAPTNRKPKLADLGIMRRHNFLSETTPMLTKIYQLTKDKESPKPNRYVTSDEPVAYAAIMKMTLNVMQTNEMGPDWSVILWNISQQTDLIPKGCTVTFTRVFERRNNKQVRIKTKRRRRLSILSSSSEENIKTQGKAIGHDMALMNAVDSGDSVLSFGAEAIVTGPDETTLESAVEAVKNYLKANDETRGLNYALDVGRQNRPFIIYGPDEAAGNKGVFTDMTSMDAAQSALFVDSGGDRTLGSEYIGVSVGKLIRSHAAYSFKNHANLFVGNDALGTTTTIGGNINEPSQVYLSKVASRAYLLSGHKVTHFVADDPDSVNALMNMPLDDQYKIEADASKGLLNMMEAIDDGEFTNAQDEDAKRKSRNRILSYFPMHINSIITLLNQFRDQSARKDISLTDDFANATRDILIDFYVTNKYWSYTARSNIDDIRLFGKHDQFKQLSDFGQYVMQRKFANKDPKKEEALSELDNIVNRNILPTIPSLDTVTKPIIDKLVRSSYRVVDLTGMNTGSRGGVSNPSLNVMMISYLNVLLPSMHNGDCIVIHGISQMSQIAGIVKNMIDTSGINIDLVFTEKNQNNALSMIAATSDTIEEEDDVNHRIKRVTRAMPLDFVMVDLYHNRSDKLVDAFKMDSEWSKQLAQNPASYFVKTEDGIDYIYLDRIL